MFIVSGRMGLIIPWKSIKHALESPVPNTDKKFKNDWLT